MKNGTIKKKTTYFNGKVNFSINYYSSVNEITDEFRDKRLLGYMSNMVEFTMWEKK